MKKRWLGLIAAVLLAVTPMLMMGAGAESALLGKMQKQLGAGSGLKGTVTASGLGGLDGLALNAQYILQKAQSQLVLSLESGEAELLKAALYGQDGMLAIDAGLNSGKLYGTSSGWESLFSSLMMGEAGETQVPLQTALYGILFPEDERLAAQLEEAAVPYLIKIDLWMQGFAGPPALTKDTAGVTVMEVSYRIPATALKAELKQLLMDLLADKTLLPLLWNQMTQAQANLYLNPALQSFYFQAVDALPLEGEITMLRRVSTAGQLMETSVSLPLGGFGNGLKRLSFLVSAAEMGEALECALETEGGTLSFTRHEVPDQGSLLQRRVFAGTIRYLPVEIPNWQVDATAPVYAEKAMSVSYQTAFTQSSSVDADGRNNEEYTLSVSLAPDWSHLTGEVTEEIRAQYILTEPVQLTASALLASGQARNASTSLSAQVRLVSGGTDFTLSGQFKTTPPWAFAPVDVAAADKLENLTQDQLSALLEELLAEPGLLPLLLYFMPADQEIPGTVG